MASGFEDSHQLPKQHCVVTQFANSVLYNMPELPDRKAACAEELHILRHVVCCSLVLAVQNHNLRGGAGGGGAGGEKRKKKKRAKRAEREQGAAALASAGGGPSEKEELRQLLRRYGETLADED